MVQKKYRKIKEKVNIETLEHKIVRLRCSQIKSFTFYKVVW